MERFKVDEAWLNAGARPVVDVFPQEERSEDGKTVIGQKRDRDSGMPLWRVEFPFKGPGDRRASMAMATVGSASEPDLVGRVPVFGGVFARKWHMNDSSGMSLTAESFSSADQRPSTQRAAAANGAPSPPPPAKASAGKS